MLGTRNAMTEPRSHRVRSTSGTKSFRSLAGSRSRSAGVRIDHCDPEIRRYVVETPMERQVTLRDETVEIERRRPVESTSPRCAGAFEERTVGAYQQRSSRKSPRPPTSPKRLSSAKTVTERPEDDPRDGAEGAGQGVGTIILRSAARLNTRSTGEEPAGAPRPGGYDGDTD